MKCNASTSGAAVSRVDQGPSARERLRSAIARLREHRSSGLVARRQGMRERFALRRERLRKHLYEDFRANDWPRLQHLNQVFMSRSGLPVPTLSVCGAGTAEIRFTQLLAYFFDSRNRHGLGGLLARAIFSDEITDGASLPFESCIAEAEIPLGRSVLRGGRKVSNSLDLMLTVGQHAILVEQKIRSNEGEEQLRRYSEAVGTRFEASNTSRFYLTPDGDEGSESAWRPLSHRTLFVRLGSVLDQPGLSAVARHNLQALLWDLMLGPLAQDSQWMDQFESQTARVVGDINRLADLKSWFVRYGLGREELRMVTKLVA